MYESSVREVNRAGDAGELAVIYDRKDRFLAVGFFDPNSPIRVRILHAGRPVQIGPTFLAARLDEAVRRRDGLFDERTTGYRLINGESDGWPGLVLDRYGDTLVMKIYTTAWLLRLGEVTELIRERLKPERLVSRLSRNLQISGAAARADGQVIFGPELEGCTMFQESGLTFESDVVRGQKTGFFLDQRENRRWVEAVAKGMSVLNAFSFSGGFSLYAARGGAKSVTDLDISAHALAAAKRNFQLNDGDRAVAVCAHEMVQADAFKWLADSGNRRFELIVLDPPSLAKRESEREGAIRAYQRLAALGIGHLSPGGILVACSCSAHVSAEEFFATVKRSAAGSGRRFVEMQTTRHAPDHHATFKEAEYLKGIYLKFD